MEAKTESRGSWVYVVGTASDPKRAKVGISKDPLERMGNMQTGDPFLYFECAIFIPNWYLTRVRSLEAVLHTALESPSSLNLNIDPVAKAPLLKARKGVAQSSRINFYNTNSPSEWFWITPALAKEFVIESIREEIPERSNNHNVLAFLQPEHFGEEVRDNSIYVYSHDALRSFFQKSGAPKESGEIIEAASPEPSLEGTLIGLLTKIIMENISPEQLAVVKAEGELVEQLNKIFNNKPKLPKSLEPHLIPKLQAESN